MTEPEVGHVGPVGPVGPEEWRAWREIRLRALAEDPAAFGSTLERETRFREADWRARLDAAGGPAFLARVDGTPVAMGAGWAYEPGRLMVVAMWTDPAHRGHGLGTRILEHVVACARGRDLTPDLWVADGNPAARVVYERFGFVGTGEVSPLREGSRLTMSRLELPAAVPAER
jgi:GNAT superfamily N-acetyltransferase